MLPELNEIKRMRERLGLTQKELAKESNVSQSMIAKIEAEKIVPSYENAKQIFLALDNFTNQKSLKAKDVMKTKIKMINQGDSVKKAISLMKENGISQLPVLNDGKNVGVLSEKDIIDAFNKNIKLNSKTKVEELMDDALPSVSEETPIKLLSDLLDHNQAVLISKSGKIIGIVTKSDLLKSVLK
ncbi:MAG: transcriptional regulator [Candidatus Diapherotrites archaeon CG08_land_8_20_14_0_20_34_12]|nr:MAG: transcriptional regulator [Candidatus Diapherotrites archaeon CG08_land_8_20_14_0_20_34_12]